MNNETSTACMQSTDAQHYLHPFTDHKKLAARGARVIVKADDIYLWDSEGKRLLDGMSGLWCVNVGYGRQSISDAVYTQMEQLPYYNSFFNTTNLPALRLAQTLSEIAPKGFQHVFFTGSGSEANDTNLRLIRRYWDVRGLAAKRLIISRQNAYHGSTIGGASLGGMAGMHNQLGEQDACVIPGIHHIGQPYYLESGQGLSEQEFGLKAASWLEQKILELGAENVAAFFAEPLQGAGGVIIPPASYWPEIQRICRKYDILLVVDEVICGFGRTGHWFACEYFGIEADLITFAKGVTSGYLPLGGVLVGERVAQLLIAEGGDFNHGFTYSGHPAACAAALENIRILRDEHLVEQVREVTGPYLQQQFASLLDHPLVGMVDGCGFLAALVLVKQKGASIFDAVMFDKTVDVGMICREHMFNNGMIMRAVGNRMIIAPPLTMSREQIDEMIALIRFCLDRTLADLQQKNLL
ncbi:MAG: aspartate aminotransferase family protein [Burkholderiales bacterium]|nr:aspartate aminotransferase family protein [Burkholderiales bacterium]